MKRDAIIIGAGPAGCVAAVCLARGGWNVQLIEQHRFPRDKVCGECLSALGADVLDRLDLSESFHRLAPVRLNRAMIHSPLGKTLEVALPREMWGISRARFDGWLLQHARIAGAHIVQPARCEQIVPPDKTSHPASGVSVQLRDLERNEIVEHQASWVFLADGKRALLPRRPAPTGDLGIKAHFKNLSGPRDAIELFGVDRHYGGVAPIEDEAWNVAFSVPRRRVQRYRGDLDELFGHIISENAVLGERFAHASRISEWFASPLGRFAVSLNWPDRVIPLGNAAASIEPVGGEGMGLAMRSAQMAGEMLLSGDEDVRALQRGFRRLWQTRRLGCRAAGMMVSQPTMARWIAPLGKSASVRAAAMALIGKRSKQFH